MTKTAFCIAITTALKHTALQLLVALPESCRKVCVQDVNFLKATQHSNAAVIRRFVCVGGF